MQISPRKQNFKRLKINSHKHGSSSLAHHTLLGYGPEAFPRGEMPSQEKAYAYMLTTGSPVSDAKSGVIVGLIITRVAIIRY